jgi:hypothetical protein
VTWFDFDGGFFLKDLLEQWRLEDFGMKARFYGYEYVVGMIPILSQCIFYFIFYCAGEVRSELLSFRSFCFIVLFSSIPHVSMITTLNLHFQIISKLRPDPTHPK